MAAMEVGLVARIGPGVKLTAGLGTKKLPNFAEPQNKGKRIAMGAIKLKPLAKC